MGYPFVISRSVASTLGDTVLGEIARNLWPTDCQACGRPFEGERPSLVIDDLGSFASAALYHRACRSSEYCTPGMVMSAGASLTYHAIGCLLPVELGNGRRDDLPVVLINPSLEHVELSRGKDNAWEVGTVEHFRRVGLTGISLGRPVAGARAEVVAPGVLRVWVGLTGDQCWDCPVDVPAGLLERILLRRGVVVGLTTAYDPFGLLRESLEEFARALGSGDVATGWVSLATQGR